MRLKGNIVLKKLGADTLAIRVDEDVADLASAIVLNDTSALLFEALTDDTDEQKLSALLMDHYNITADKAKKDVKAFLSLMSEKGLLLFNE